MGLDDKIEHNTQDAKGKLKEGAGKATGSDKLETEGKVDQTKADVEKAGEDVKDAFKS
ncbi:CsbD family protein [Oerskovia enterophila]|uniref:CsbD family protein n=1 Tax=Oerskovia enterophila TaxID=43678 RepID=UPI0033991221